MKKVYLFAFAALAGAANATVWEMKYTATPGVTNDAAGKIDSVDVKYNDSTKLLSYDVAFGKASGTNALPNGFWLVLSDGPNPKGINNELAIAYMDASQANAPALTVNNYNGQNADNSWNGGQKILSSKVSSDSKYIKSLYAFDTNSGERKMGFVLDATKINNFNTNKDWKGMQIGKEAGIWFHPVDGLKTSYSNGFLCGWSYTTQGWFDGSNIKTTPEPATLAALGLGGLALLRKRKSK